MEVMEFELSGEGLVVFQRLKTGGRGMPGKGSGRVWNMNLLCGSQWGDWADYS